MRVLLPPGEPQSDPDLHAFYADGWLERGGLRMNFVASTDGAVTEGGRSRGLQTKGDNKVFAALRDLADVVLVGARTALIEGYQADSVGPQRAALRRSLGLAEQLPTAVLSRSLRLDPEAPLFAQAPPDTRTIVLTCDAGDPAVRSALEPVSDVVICGDDDVDLVVARQALEERGLTRILGEGGPTLFASLARAGVVNELCLSVTPILAGPGAGRIVNGPAWPGDPLPMRLSALLEEAGALFCRYAVGTVKP